jgi:hypothetical protein
MVTARLEMSRALYFRVKETPFTDTKLEASSVIDALNFATLNSSDEYARYFHLLCAVFARVIACYRKEEDQDSYEARIVTGHLNRLLFTIQLLRIKYTYNLQTTRPLWVDLTDSGFPNASEIAALNIDLESRAERMRELPAESILKRSMLDYIFERKSEPRALLAQLSERTYLKMLSEREVFLPFVPGTIDLQSERTKARSYLFSWSCYDFRTNCPYIHIMTFDQDTGEAPLGEPGRRQDNFLEVIAAEGSRSPDLGVLALALDDAMESIHPKIIKRIRIGPLYARMLLDGRPENTDDKKEMAFRLLLGRFSRNRDDFAIFFNDGIVFSKRQRITQSLLSPRGKVREVFAIQETDPECYKRRVSVIHRHLLLPHHMLQHIGEREQAWIPHFGKTRKLTFDAGGEVHGL